MDKNGALEGSICLVKIVYTTRGLGGKTVAPATGRGNMCGTALAREGRQGVVNRSIYVQRRIYI